MILLVFKKIKLLLHYDYTESNNKAFIPPLHFYPQVRILSTRFFQLLFDFYILNHLNYIFKQFIFRISSEGFFMPRRHFRRTFVRT